MTTIALVVIPLLAMGVYVLADILRRPSPTWVKVAWIVSIIVVWPLMLLYLLSRPPSGRIEDKQVEHVEDSIGPRSRLVQAVTGHDDGDIPDAAFETTLAGLRGGRPRGQSVEGA